MKQQPKSSARIDDRGDILHNEMKTTTEKQPPIDQRGDETTDVTRADARDGARGKEKHASA